MLFNISEGKSYYSQRNNKIRPGGACGATGATNALVASGIDFDHPAKMQPEDYIMLTLQSSAAYAKLRQRDPDAQYNPWNTSYLIAWAVNKIVGRQVCKVEYLSIEDMIFHMIREESALVVGGSFTRSGHFVCIVGFESDQDEILQASSPQQIDISMLQGILIDDSWGDYRGHYRSHDGNDILMPLEDFKKIVMRGKDTKTCQVYYRSAAA